MLKPLSSQEVCEDQIKMREKILQEKESQTLESSKVRTKRGKHERKKISETLEVRENFLATKGEVKGLFHSKQPLYLLICKNYVLTTNTFDNFEFPSSVKTLLQEFEDVFPSSVPSRLPPLRGIEHQIDLMLGASLPNRPAYRSNPQETKEIQSDVNLTRNGSFDTGYGVLDDATSSEGR